MNRQTLAAAIVLNLALGFCGCAKEAEQAPNKPRAPSTKMAAEEKQAEWKKAPLVMEPIDGWERDIERFHDSVKLILSRSMVPEHRLGEVATLTAEGGKTAWEMELDPAANNNAQAQLARAFWKGTVVWEAEVETVEYDAEAKATKVTVKLPSGRLSLGGGTRSIEIPRTMPLSVPDRALPKEAKLQAGQIISFEFRLEESKDVYQPIAVWYGVNERKGDIALMFIIPPIEQVHVRQGRSEYPDQPRQGKPFERKDLIGLWVRPRKDKEGKPTGFRSAVKFKADGTCCWYHGSPNEAPAYPGRYRTDARRIDAWYSAGGDEAEMTAGNRAAVYVYTGNLILIDKSGGEAAKYHRGILAR